MSNVKLLTIALEQGGPVLWLILACGIVAFICFLERSFHLHRARIRYDDFLNGIFNILKKENIDEALTICDETPGPVARVVKVAVMHRNASRTQIESDMNEAGLAEISRLESRVGVIAVVAQIAPLLGLLGTVLGLMVFLTDMQASHWQAAGVTTGLWRALLTTAFGLFVAIPCYVAYSLVVGKIESLVIDMEKAMSEMIAFLTGGQ